MTVLDARRTLQRGTQPKSSPAPAPRCADTAASAHC
jgi:hypothetical protein